MDLLDLEIENIQFKNKKIPISAEMRPLFRITRLMLVLEYASRSNASSLLKLQLFDWAFQDKERYKLIENFIVDSYFPIIKFDPFVIKAINYGLALRLIETNSNQKFILSYKGREWLSRVKEQNVFKDEINLLNVVKKSITESKIIELSKRRYRL